MSRALLVALFAVAVAVACAGRCPPARPAVAASPPTPAETVAQVQAVVDRYRGAYEQRSVAALGELYLQASELRATWQGHTLTGWAAVAEALQAFFAEKTQVRLRIDNLLVVSLGEGGAVASMSLHRTYGDGVTTVDEVGGLTLALRRVEDGWRIVAEHRSYAAAP